MSAISLTEFTEEIKQDQSLQSVIASKIKQENMISMSHVVKSMIEAGEEKGYHFRLSEVEVLSQEIMKQKELVDGFKNGTFKSIDDKTLNLFPI